MDNRDDNDGHRKENRKSGYPKSFEKWGIDIVRAGYTLVPNHFININLYLSKESKLSPTELMVLIIIISNWWNPRMFPAASKKYIGDRCNLSNRQVQRIISSLEEKNIIQRLSGHTTGGANKFDLRNILQKLRWINEGINNPEEYGNQLEFSFEDDDFERYRLLYFGNEDEDIPF